MNVVLIRHTRLVAAAGLCYGRTELPLAGTFAEEAADVRERLGRAPSLVFTSPAARCRRLADELGAENVRVDARLLELDFGAWENRRWDDVPRAEVDAWAEDFVERSPPGGESFRTLVERVAEFWREREAEGKDVVVVTHAGVIRAWLCLAEGRSLPTAFERAVEFGEVVNVEASSSSSGEGR